MKDANDAQCDTWIDINIIKLKVSPSEIVIDGFQLGAGER